jgi:hypothetical protein
VAESLKTQGHFKHLFSPENEGLMKKVQEDIDRDRESVLKEEARQKEN